MSCVFVCKPEGRNESQPLVFVCLCKYYVVASVEVLYVCAVCLSDVELLRIYKVL